MKRITYNSKGFNKTIFAERLKALRMDAGLTQEEMAERIDVSTRTYQSWEEIKKYDGTPITSMPSLTKVMAICYEFNCDLDYLIGRIESKLHDTEDICNALGLSEKAVRSILALNKYETENPQDSLERLALLSALMENQEILQAIAEYLIIDIGLMDITISSQGNKNARVINLNDNETVKINGLVDLSEDILRTAAVNHITKSLEGVKGIYLSAMKDSFTTPLRQ